MKNLDFLFCCDYFDDTQPDIDYASEYECVKKHGRDAYLFSLDSFLENGRLKITKTEQPKMLIYRGWMMATAQYAALYDSLLEKNFTLINTPEQYRHCHCLPSWYELLKDNTAKSWWTEGIPNEQLLLQLLRDYENKPLFVKDYVKSRKHEWAEACFIPNASNTKTSITNHQYFYFKARCGFSWRHSFTGISIIENVRYSQKK